MFIWSPDEESPWQPGGASKWWLHQSLARLAAACDAAGSELVIARGSSLAELQRAQRQADLDGPPWDLSLPGREPAPRGHRHPITRVLEEILDTFESLLGPKSGEPVGRQLDFLAQELNREANTLASKSQDVRITRECLAVKNELESIRQHVQNIE